MNPGPGELVLGVKEHDALVEVVNIAFGLALATLADLTGSHLRLQVPKVEVHPIEMLSSAMGPCFPEGAVSIHQVFSGALNGDAFLALDQRNAVLLVQTLTGQKGDKMPLSASDREVLEEIGNILLTGFLGTISNLLKVHISFTVPDVRLEMLEMMVRSIVVANTGLRYALLITMNFDGWEGGLQGNMVLALGVTSLEKLQEVLEQLG